jgi:hypothetical protein
MKSCAVCTPRRKCCWDYKFRLEYLVFAITFEVFQVLLSWRDARAQRRQAAGRLSYKPFIEALENRLVMSVGTTPAPSLTFQAEPPAAFATSAGMFEMSAGTTPAPSSTFQVDPAAAFTIPAGSFYLSVGTTPAPSTFQVDSAAVFAISAGMFDLTRAASIGPCYAISVQMLLPVFAPVPVRQPDYVMLSNIDDHGLGAPFVGPLPALPTSFAAFSPLSSSADLGVAHAASNPAAERAASGPSTGIGLHAPVPPQQTTLIVSGLFNPAGLPLGTFVVTRESPLGGGPLGSAPVLAQTTAPDQADDAGPNETARIGEVGRDVYHQPLYRVADRGEVGVESYCMRVPLPALDLSGTGSVGAIIPSPLEIRDDTTPSAPVPPTAAPETATAVAAQSSLSFLEVAAIWAGFQIMYVHIVRQDSTFRPHTSREAVMGGKEWEAFK